MRACVYYSLSVHKEDKNAKKSNHRPKIRAGITNAFQLITNAARMLTAAWCAMVSGILALLGRRQNHCQDH